jgi:hypothetical protein
LLYQYPEPFTRMHVHAHGQEDTLAVSIHARVQKEK